MGGMTYTMFKNAAGAQAAGCIQTMEGEPGPNWLVYIGVDDIDATTARAKELGANVIVEPTDIPNDIGRFSVLQDPAGAVFGLFKPTAAAQ
jgi:predicted enzyme related to lactoylglutathione lyase